MAVGELKLEEDATIGRGRPRCGLLASDDEMDGPLLAVAASSTQAVSLGVGRENDRIEERAGIARDEQGGRARRAAVGARRPLEDARRRSPGECWASAGLLESNCQLRRWGDALLRTLVDVA